MEELKNLIKYSLFTGYLVDEKPISLLIIAPSESGKTEVLDNFKELNGVVYVNDTTPFGIVKVLNQLQALGKKVNHIIIPDLLNPLSKSQPSVRGFVHFFNSIMEEGLTKIETAGIQFNIEPIQCGLISAITVEGYKARKAYWTGVGFLRRMLPFSYQYDNPTVYSILDNIIQQGYLKVDSEKIVFPKEKQSINLEEKFARQMLPYSLKLGTEKGAYGFTDQKHFQRLLKAIALSKGKVVVDQSDVDDLKKCAVHMNLDFKCIK
jgi:hypothetical protein